MKRTLSIIVISQFLCTSTWFAGNSVMSDLMLRLSVDSGFLAHLTSAIQFGFISGTLVFAAFALPDRFSPSRIFFVCSFAAAVFNLGLCVDGLRSNEVLLLRFCTGFFLAGIYPVGMKIASDYSNKGLGLSLGFLVGALVLGTAFPSLVQSLTLGLSWKAVIITTSASSLVGGLAVNYLVPDGPYRTVAKVLNIRAFVSGFNNREFRSASFGYFGHMWELYTFWAMVPFIIEQHNLLTGSAHLNVPLLTFFSIASGMVSCILGGFLSLRFGARNVAGFMLFLSGLCCVLSPIIITQQSPVAFVCFIVFWGMTVVGDSPQFSTLIAQQSTPEARGSSLTIVHCIGFAITIISIQVLHILGNYLNLQFQPLALALGPLVGLFFLLRSHK